MSCVQYSGNHARVRLTPEECMNWLTVQLFQIYMRHNEKKKGGAKDQNEKDGLFIVG